MKRFVGARPALADRNFFDRVSAEPTAGWKPIYPLGGGRQSLRARETRHRIHLAESPHRACLGPLGELLSTPAGLGCRFFADSARKCASLFLSGLRPDGDQRTAVHLHERSDRRYFRARLRVLSRCSRRAVPCLGRELRTRSLSIPRRCARARSASICENLISAELGGIGAELQS